MHRMRNNKIIDSRLIALKERRILLVPLLPLRDYSGVSNQAKKLGVDIFFFNNKSIFDSGDPIKDTANNILNNNDNKFAKQLAKFVINTKRGIPFARK